MASNACGYPYANPAGNARVNTHAHSLPSACWGPSSQNPLTAEFPSVAARFGQRFGWNCKALTPCFNRCVTKRDVPGDNELLPPFLVS